MSQSIISFEVPNLNGSLNAFCARKRKKTPNDSKDDESEGVKQMRGLEGLRICICVVIENYLLIHYKKNLNKSHYKSKDL